MVGKAAAGLDPDRVSFTVTIRVARARQEAAEEHLAVIETYIPDVPTYFLLGTRENEPPSAERAIVDCRRECGRPRGTGAVLVDGDHGPATEGRKSL